MLLWVAGWFPNSENPYNGIFIHRHAQAASKQIQNLTLLTFVPFYLGERKPINSNWERNYQCIIVPVPQFKGRLFKILNFLIFYSTTTGKMLQLLIEHRPQIVHVHAADKIGVVAAFLKSYFDYKLWLTEHWAIFNDWVPDRFEKRNPWFKFSFKYLWGKTDACASINLNLHQSMEQHLGSVKKYYLYPNVLDASFENSKPTDVIPKNQSSSGNFHFLHVSNFEPRKNTELIVEAFNLLKKEFPDAHLTLIGAPVELREKLIETWQEVNKQGIQILGAIPAAELMDYYHKASALLLFSDSENAPCVISEALSFGVPVLASGVGGIPEMINSENGILIKDWNPQENNSAKTLKITTAMLDFCKKCKNFDRLQIQENAKLIYSSERVAKQLIHYYTCAE